MSRKCCVSTMIVVGMLAALASPASAGAITRWFQQGVNGYTGTFDTELDEGNPNTPKGGYDRAFIDHHLGEQQGLIRFEDIFGGQSHQVPIDATLISAQLTLSVVDSGDCGADLHRMLVPWSEQDTWNSMVNGIQTDDTEAASAVDGSLTTSVSVGNVVTIDLDVGTLEGWQSNPSSNFGWVLKWHNTLQDGWAFDSSEEEPDMFDRPQLSVQFVVPEPGTLSLLALGGLAVLSRRRTA